VREASVLTLDEAAAYLRMSPSGLRGMAQRGAVPATKLGKLWRFDRCQLEAWVRGEALSRMAEREDTAALRAAAKERDALRAEVDDLQASLSRAEALLSSPRRGRPAKRPVTVGR